MRRKSHVRIGGGRELQGSFLPLREVQVIYGMLSLYNPR